MDAVSSGKTLRVSVELLGMRTRAVLRAADRESLSAEALGEKVSLKWSDLSDAAFVRLAGKCAGDTPDSLEALVRVSSFFGLEDDALRFAERLKEVSPERFRKIEPLVPERWESPAAALCSSRPWRVAGFTVEYFQVGAVIPAPERRPGGLQSPGRKRPWTLGIWPSRKGF